MRVGFDKDGITHPKSAHLLTAALLMAEKHESHPSTTRRSKYRTTIEVCSASRWTKWNLDLFNAKFDKDKYTDLWSFLREDAYRMDSKLEAGNANMRRG